MTRPIDLPEKFDQNSTFGVAKLTPNLLEEVKNFPKLKTEIQSDVRKKRRKMSALIEIQHAVAPKNVKVAATQYIEENCFHKRKKNFPQKS